MEDIESSIFTALHPHRVDGWGITANSINLSTDCLSSSEHPKILNFNATKSNSRL